jgi:hypothetical protein
MPAQITKKVLQEKVLNARGTVKIIMKASSGSEKGDRKGKRREV